MKNMRMVLAMLILISLMAFSTACATSYRVKHFEDHPVGNTTLLETETTRHMFGGLYNKTEYNYWECQRNEAGLDCHKACYNPNQFGSFPASVGDQDLACLKYGMTLK